MLGTAEGDKTLRWRPWPCSACSGGLSQIGVLISGIEAGTIVLRDQPEKLSTAQRSLLIDWCYRCSHKIEQQVTLPKLDEGSEHSVLLDSATATVFKATLPHTFGESYYLKNGRVHQESCSPLDYLVRLRLWRKVFGSAPIDLGVTPTGQVVSMQPYITGVLPAQEEVNNFLTASGLEPVRKDCFLWKTTSEDFDIWAGDTRDENFVATDLGIVPIDIRMWFTNSN